MINYVKFFITFHFVSHTQFPIVHQLQEDDYYCKINSIVNGLRVDNPIAAEPVDSLLQKFNNVHLIQTFWQLHLEDNQKIRFLICRLLSEHW